jgi:hypothetical protein
LEANEQAVSFFVKVNTMSWVYADYDVEYIDSDSVDNAKTQEKLVIKGVDDEYVTIARYPMAASVDWIKQIEKSVEDLLEEEWNNEDQNRKIELNF